MSPPEQDPEPGRGRQRRLVIITGMEGAGKSTLIRALLPETPAGARLDAEDVGQVNPCHYDEAFHDLLRRNVAALVQNYWNAGYHHVLTGSFVRNYDDYRAFRDLLPEPFAVDIVELLVAKPVRDHRRVTRAKQTTQEWRDMVDLADPEDFTLRQARADYRYLGIDTTRLDVPATVRRIQAGIPEIYGDR